MVGLPRPTSRDKAIYIILSETEFAEELRNTGWGEDAIEKELEVLREYKRRFRLEEKTVVTVEENASSELVQAVRRKRQRLEGN